MSENFISGGSSSSSGTVSPTVMFIPGSGFSATANSALSGANKIQLSGFYLPNSLTLNNIIVKVTTSDGVNSYDWGIYDAGGTLKAHVGINTVASTGVVDLPVVGAPVSLQPGKYYFAFTGNATTARIAVSIANVSTLTATFCAATTESATSGGGTGGLSSSATMPADSWSITNGNIHGFVLH